MLKNREGFLVGEFERECTKCGTIFNKTSKTVTLCNKCNTERVKSTSTESKMFRRAKSRAIRDNIPFDIEISDIVIPKICPILGLELEVFCGGSGGRPNSPALDRIDNSKGYTKGNVAVISHMANQMKSSADEKLLIKFAEWVMSTYCGELTTLR